MHGQQNIKIYFLVVGYSWYYI